MAAPATAPKRPGKGGIFNTKNGGFPAAVWGVGLILAIGIGLYIKHRAAASTAASPSTSSTGDPNAAQTGGASSTGTGTGSLDSQAFEDLAYSIQGLTGILGGGGGLSTPTSPGSGTTAPTFVYGYPPDLVFGDPGLIAGPPGTRIDSSHIVGFNGAPVLSFVGAGTPTGAQPIEGVSPGVVGVNGAAPPTLVQPPTTTTNVRDLPGVGATLPGLTAAPAPTDPNKPAPGKPVNA